jgi:hypothetical protein
LEVDQIMNALKDLRCAMTWRGPVVLSLAASLFSLDAASQPDGVDPLFASDDPLTIRIEVPLRQLVNRMKSIPEVEGQVVYTDGNGQDVALEVEVRTRGKSRLEICSFPPLSINFRRSEVPGTLFAGQNRIKLVTECKTSTRYEQYLYLELLAYQIYQLVSDYSYQTRFVNVSYVDTTRSDRVTEAPAFFLEHIERLAARAGMRAGELERAPFADLSPEQTTLFSVFEFMIGNTDWSTLRPNEDDDECCHNADLLIPTDATAPIIPVPFDFDQAGLVDTEYALPAEGLRIRRVTQRLYRGLCRDNDYVDEAAARFVAARGAIAEAIMTSHLDASAREKASEFIASGFEVLTDPALLDEEIKGSCRG